MHTVSYSHICEINFHFLIPIDLININTLIDCFFSTQLPFSFFNHVHIDCNV